MAVYKIPNIFTKLLLALIVFPAFGLISNYLIRSTGRTNISSGDFISFFMSIQGIILIMLAMLLLILLVGTDINAFIIISSLINENKIKMKTRSMILVGIKSIKSFINPSGILIFLYIAIIVPIVGIGVSVSPMKNFQIPNFITSVIFNNNLYLFIYSSLIIILSIITFVFIFTFHYVLILNQSIKEAMISSAKLVKKYWFRLIKDYFGRLIVYFLIFIIIALIISVPFIGIFGLNDSSKFIERIKVIFLFLNIAESITYVTFIYLPISIGIVTTLFYRYNEREGLIVKGDFNIDARELGEDLYKRVKIKTKMSLLFSMVILVIANVVISIVCAIGFDSIFKTNPNIQIIAHRGGGNLEVENSIAGLKEAIKNKVDWAEFDVQRTKDNHYIINHDPSFGRLSGVNKSSNEMTLSEIKKLKVKNEFHENMPERPVATLEEYLNTAKGKIGLFIELKGKTADEKMADDVIKLVKSKSMVNSSVILSLDYDLIKYIENKYPSIKTGYLYYFNIGSPAEMVSDYLIMEEREATESNIDDIHAKNKKAIVWTVNTPESISNFTKTNVDGIITDNVLDVIEGKKESNSRSDYDRIIDMFLN